MAEICSAELTGCKDGSCSLVFKPESIKPSEQHVADPGTAGSTTLLLQISLPPLLFSPTLETPTNLILRGGTNASQAPQIDYTLNVFLPFLHQNFGISVTLAIRTRGYYPKGGGEVHVTVPPRREPIPAIVLVERGEIIKVSGRAFVAGLPRRLADTMQKAAVEMLQEYGMDERVIHIDSIREKATDAVGSGSGIVLWAETEQGCLLGGSALGSKNKDPAQVGREAADVLIRNLKHGGCVDEYMQVRDILRYDDCLLIPELFQDQMIIFLALAQGRSAVKTGPLTLHTKYVDCLSSLLLGTDLAPRTAIWIAEQLTDAKFELHEDTSGAVILHCEGIGLVPR